MYRASRMSISHQYTWRFSRIHANRLMSANTVDSAASARRTLTLRILQQGHISAKHSHNRHLTEHLASTGIIYSQLNVLLACPATCFNSPATLPRLLDLPTLQITSGSRRSQRHHNQMTPGKIDWDSRDRRNGRGHHAPG